MAIDMTMIKDLREKTQAGIADCKKALEACNGDMAKAIDYLREKGLSTAVKKSGRIASEGIVDSYIHGGGRIGVLLEVNCETDFVARNEIFRQFVKDMAMQIAASQPLYIAKEDVPAEALEREANVLKAQARNEGKPEKIIEKIVEGRMSKYYEDFCLLEQSFVKDPEVKVKDVLTQTIAKLNENIKIRRFVRYERGEGLEKKEENFAEEVQKQLNG
ncbi:MAG: translation elongation factor Ts [Clostridia bacterium]|nr:translation elongation factor Ts [Clostridia bacterium]MBO7398706.1 translation elongation factor Ts [Clostridia bacterium]MBO7503487.1 translation elongation factor Ts [Clostridia bacterium]MBO7658885.1 translation elongation factor Ts [Clostridia bacterium]MBP5666443.1 translation elongation factor Ts [Clostridia bacterium]